VTRTDQYRTRLRALDRRDWPAFLGEHSGLPGPRANIELGRAVADEGDPAVFDRLIASDEEYLVFCGVLGLGRRLAEKPDAALVGQLKHQAADGRWRVREAVAMALQRVGDADLPRLLDLAARWAGDPAPLVQRAAVAGLCEPRLLTEAPAAARALEACATATESLAARPLAERTDPGVRALRQTLGYGWSVAVAADPTAGLPRFQELRISADRDVQWIVRENCRKARLAHLLP